METQYIGEHLLPGYLGKGLIWFSLLMAVISLAFYLRAFIDERKNSNKSPLPSIAFGLHTLSLAAVAALLLGIIINHYFEYAYVWQYSGLDMKKSYIISAFWAGQEGSYILWALLQALIAMFVVFMVKDFKSGIMTAVSAAQILLVTMLLGVEIAGVKIGKSPFSLLRETALSADMDFFSNPAYLQNITDGNGLNPLLENPWMLWHPPVLFLGYAATLIPFGFAFAGMFRSDLKAWIKPAIPWMLFAVLSLGAGLLLGGMWAYESLTFGGFWAWDPVENASLVPWLVLVASLHFMIIARKRDQNIVLAFFTTLCTYALVIYASFLTRSGILGETSVHAFSGDSRSWQLLLFLTIFTVVPLAFLLLKTRKSKTNLDSSSLTKGFWILLGNIIILLAAFQVIFTTSLPVINKILGTNFAPPVNAIGFYNQWQMIFVTAFALIMGFTNFLSYAPPDKKKVLRNFILSFVISVIVFLSVAFLFKVKGGLLLIFLFAVILMIVSSLHHIRLFAKNKRNWGGIITHIGIGVFLAGVALTFSRSQVITRNVQQPVPGIQQGASDNLLLVKDNVMPAGDYFISYSNKVKQGRKIFYQVDFLKTTGTGNYELHFSVMPSVLLNQRMGNVFEPSIRHFWDKDVYTHITNADVLEDDYELISRGELAIKDTIKLAEGKVVLDSVWVTSMGQRTENLAIRGLFKVKGAPDTVFTAEAAYVVSNNSVYYSDGIIDDLAVKVRIERVSDKPNTLIVGVYGKKIDYIVIKAIINPNINLMWFGALLALAGILFALIRRLKGGLVSGC